MADFSERNIVSKMGSEKHYIYMVECSDKTLYTGYTNNLESRIKAHNTGKGAKYTGSRLPVRLVYFETFDNKNDAMKREWYIKHKLKRSDKLDLIKNMSKGESHETDILER